MDVQDRLDQLVATVRNAKAIPMSTACKINRAEVLAILERLREELPANLDHADALMFEREAVVAVGREQAERILESARREREQLMEQTDVLVAARAQAEALTAQARAESSRLLSDADDYVDGKLADFEAFLGQLSSQVNNGRLRLTARRAADLANFQESAHEAARGDARRQDTTAGPGNSSAPEVAQHRGAATADASAGAR